VAHYTSLQKFLADPATTGILTTLVEQSAAPLQVIEAGQYAIDSTGFSTAVYVTLSPSAPAILETLRAWAAGHFEPNEVVRPQFIASTLLHAEVWKRGA
jgi:hypothetical protein